MTKQERKLTKKLLKEIERLAAHMRQSKYELPIKEAQLALLDENGEGLGLCMTVGIDEETGEIVLDRTMEEIDNRDAEELEIEVELEGNDHYEDDFEEEWDSSFVRKPTSRLLN